ncbi:holo-ACP synthase AcpS [Aeromicrobium terrae]|uniref:Holo-[acyl-carrier-protein] synthase n=1 Tax=Aeromicrobium terrae TaxID=2498846 RepID=A0A5C8NLI6_9ACTN|nr:holo-ACP synthase [Aeromicrobium terrae]TXL61927.1 holo-ACP synthase [Aeromicrobium terrae]
MTILGVGVDLVHVPGFAEQLEQPGSRFEGVFTPGERRDANGRTTDASRHLAARWAAKEAVVKAWSASLHGSAPVMGDEALGLIEVVTDAWGRPRIRLHGEVAKHLEDVSIEISLSHDGDYATAYAVLVRST